MAIFGMMPVMTAPRPLYSASGVSRLIISLPVVKKPRRFACSPLVLTSVPSSVCFTPGVCARRDSCIRTLMVSVPVRRGEVLCKRDQTKRMAREGFHHASTTSSCTEVRTDRIDGLPQVPIRFVAADVRLLPLWPLPFDGDIVPFYTELQRRIRYSNKEKIT